MPLSKEQHLDPMAGPKRILALDGGGIRQTGTDPQDGRPQMGRGAADHAGRTLWLDTKKLWG